MSMQRTQIGIHDSIVILCSTPLYRNDLILVIIIIIIIIREIKDNARFSFPNSDSRGLNIGVRGIDSSTSQGD